MITKNKNLIFVPVGKSQYVIDLNTGVVLGLNGQPLKTKSKILISQLSNIDNYECKGYLAHKIVGNVSLFLVYLQSNCREVYNIYEQLDNIGFNLSENYNSYRFIDFVKDNLSELTKLKFKHNTNDIDYLVNILKNRDIEDLREKYHIDNEINCDVVRTYQEKGKNLDLINEWYYFSNSDFSLVKYEEYLKLNDNKPYTYSKNIFKDYVINKKVFNDTKDIKLNQRLEKLANNLKCLGYNNNEYAVLIPQSAEDFRNESDKMHNCVERCYMENHSFGKTIIVFIRKVNEINKPYITCEIDVNTLQIRQALRSHNNYCSVFDKAFLEEYNKYLKGVKLN